MPLLFLQYDCSSYQVSEKKNVYFSNISPDVSCFVNPSLPSLEPIELPMPLFSNNAKSATTHITVWQISPLFLISLSKALYG